MAYAAVISLRQTIDRLLNSPHISILPPFTEFIDFETLKEQEQRMDSSTRSLSEVLHEMLGVDSSHERGSRKKFLPEILEFDSLQECLRRLDDSTSSSTSQRIYSLDVQIRETAYKLEDKIESHVLNQFLLSQSDGPPSLFSLDLQEVKQDIDSYTRKTTKLKDEYVKELSNDSLAEEEDDDDDDDDSVSSRTEFGGKKSTLVGLSDEIISCVYTIVHQLSKELEIVSIVGMAGIGKTTLAIEIFDHPAILQHFHHRAWVKVGPKYQLKDILRSILAQVNLGYDHKTLVEEGDGELADLKRVTRESLMGRRYLIVLDDVWKRVVWDELKKLLPKKRIGNRVLLTTRLQEVAHSASFVNTFEKSFMKKEQSWDLLREKVFGDEESCSYELEKAGKKIAEKCEGLPLTIVAVADILSKSEKTVKYWNKVAEKQNSVFFDAYEKISKVLLPSYIYLPQHLKPCFLYMGAFPQDYDIPLSKLINLWSAEGFLEVKPFETSEYLAWECLRGLVSKNVAMVRKRTSLNGIKSCGLHSAFWHLCLREARRNKFLHVLTSYADGLAQDIENQRRLCIHNNVLFGIKDVHNSMTSVSTTRSLLCTGPYHQYSVPVCSELRLLRVLDALTIRFYEFPIEVLKLIQLRYLALTYNGILPPSISKLWKLEYLIVHRHFCIVKSGANYSSYLPMEVWDMKELKHLEVTGRNLPNPSEGSLLPNLLTLLDVSPQSCTKDVFEGMPNLQKLGIRIEFAPDASESSNCFDHVSHLNELKSLKCVVVNPVFDTKVVAPPKFSIFPERLKKLSLSGFGYPWEDMNKIALLPNLEVLKLQCHAFRGSIWEMHGSALFRELRYLLIEDTDLVHWTAEDGSFPWLKRLSIKHCYKLERIPRRLITYGFLELIEVVDCNPSVVNVALEIEESREKRNNYIDVRIRSSWED
ncbi:PREDICTED: putative late blight resistance protein homolog R1A-10 [Erythranthe guttata]|uniref:putative late blight resistance protein homolog R1A-10 n=1 Tax=Erythranthe guttata TaxID=4155 RepID=UPI00064DEA49|nr:PREDICTED: putative late blight resistance protein homolog R1A-10 [Erythranthe guttata]|eukprot:XP_012829191.1 PREDICTED: putative late blight resistance protein homolog R1A-10 [Erythranthe guttata]